MNKYTAHVPTEQYGFIAIDVEGDVYDAVEAYRGLQQAWKGTGAGLADQQWRDLLDEYIATGKISNGGEIWEELDERQRWLINEIKKSIKRRQPPN